MAGYIGNKAVNLSTSGADISGTANLDAVDIDGAVNMATTALVTGVLTTTAATVFNGGFASNAASTITTADNSAQLKLISTDADANSGPVQVFYRNSGSPADSDLLGEIHFRGRNDNSQDVEYVTISTRMEDVSDGTEDGKIILKTMVAGTARSRIEIDHNDVVINQDSIDSNLRVESDGNTHMLFVDAGANAVGIGTASAGAIATANSRDGLVVGSGGGNNGVTIYSGNTANSSIMFADATSGSGTYIGQINYDHNADAMLFSTAATQRMVILSSGNVGIGTAQPTQKLRVEGNIQSTGQFYAGTAGAGTPDYAFAADTSLGMFRIPGALGFATGGTERSRLTSAGDLLVGTTSIPTGSGVGVGIQADAGGAFLSRRTSTTNNNSVALFYNPNGLVGSIQTSGSATSFNTSSDYRLKTDAQPMTGASARVQALNPVNFQWIADGTRVDGFLAHEAQEVVPEAVTGTKDAMMDEEYQVSAATGDIYTPATDAYVDEDGNDVDAVDEVIHSADAEQPETLEDGQQWRETTAAVMRTRSVPDMQGIDQSKMVPLLVAALQEALARITALENA